jgi:hypothetical protein
MCVTQMHVCVGVLQVTTLISERDSMASTNLTLANTTSRLIAASANGTAAAAGSEAGAGGAGAADAGVSASSSGFDVGVSLLDCSNSFRGDYRSVSAPGGPAAPAAAAGAGAGLQGAPHGTTQRSHSAAPEVGGAVISPSQAREIGALLTRLTNENTQFLKARDAAVASRNEALNRAAALEAELELRQQQLRWGAQRWCSGGIIVRSSGLKTAVG